MVEKGDAFKLCSKGKGTNMNQYINKIEKIIKDSHVQFEHKSYEEKDELKAIMAYVDGVEKLIVDGANSSQFEGDELTSEEGSLKVCPLNHENRLILNKEFSYTAPQAFGRDTTTFGFGDRLGLANPGHLASIENTNVKPVLAQQSIRELSFTNRTFDDVIDAAAWSVFRAGYKHGYGADGDHLKSIEEVKESLIQGASMITLDCSLVLRKLPDDRAKLKAMYEEIPDDYRKSLEQEYLQKAELVKFGIEFNQEILTKTILIYYDAIELAKEVQDEINKLDRQVDLEISLDETEYTTDITAHYLVANEMDKSGITINSMAPKFVGQFHKAIDYIGDLDEFRENLRSHYKIADHFGYKISLHSGSDKFKIYDIFSEETRGRFHAKTAGTSWLEAVRVIAKTEPDLYRDIHNTAIASFEEAKNYYEVNSKVENMRPLGEVADSELDDYLNQDDARQIIHITYGFMLRDNKDLRERIYDALEKHKEEYEKDLIHHFEKHLRPLGLM